MRLCNEVLILKEEKEKMMKQLYKNDYSLLSKEEKTELFQYFAQLSIIDKNDQVRKKKFLIEFTVLKLIKNFLNRQRSIVKQMSLKNNFEDSSHVTENTNKEIMSFNKKESLIEKTQDTRRLECLKSEKDEGYKKYTKKLKDLKSDSPSSFENLYAKFKKTKEKYERNLHNIN